MMAALKRSGAAIFDAAGIIA